MDDDSDMYHGAALQLIGVTSPHSFWLYPVLAGTEKKDRGIIGHIERHLREPRLRLKPGSVLINNRH